MAVKYPGHMQPNTEWWKTYIVSITFDVDLVILHRSTHMYWANPRILTFEEVFTYDIELSAPAPSCGYGNFVSKSGAILQSPRGYGNGVCWCTWSCHCGPKTLRRSFGINLSFERKGLVEHGRWGVITLRDKSGQLARSELDRMLRS